MVVMFNASLLRGKLRQQRSAAQVDLERDGRLTGTVRPAGGERQHTAAEHGRVLAVLTVKVVFAVRKELLCLDRHRCLAASAVDEGRTGQIGIGNARVLRLVRAVKIRLLHQRGRRRGACKQRVLELGPELLGRTDAQAAFGVKVILPAKLLHGKAPREREIGHAAEVKQRVRLGGIVEAFALVHRVDGDLIVSDGRLGGHGIFTGRRRVGPRVLARVAVADKQRALGLGLIPVALEVQEARGVVGHGEIRNIAVDDQRIFAVRAVDLGIVERNGKRRERDSDGFALVRRQRGALQQQKQGEHKSQKLAAFHTAFLLSIDKRILP